MHRGFIVEISNNKDIVINRKLFVSDSLVDGIEVKVLNSD